MPDDQGQQKTSIFPDRKQKITFHFIVIFSLYSIVLLFERTNERIQKNSQV